MIRLIIVLVIVFLLWLLFISQFSKNRKIAISVVAVLLCGFGIWLDDYRKKAVEGVVGIEDLQVCGVSGQHSYRTNFDITLCLQNAATKGTVKRVTALITASRCNTANMCAVIDQVQRARSLDLPPGGKVEVQENLNFSNLDATAQDIQWSSEILAVKAVR